jgi:hypothetical protein
MINIYTKMAKHININAQNNKNMPHIIDNHGNVYISNVADGEILVYDASDTYWKNYPGSGGLPLNLSFIDLHDFHAGHSYAGVSPNEIVRANSTPNMIEFSSVSLTKGTNEFTITSGSTDIHCTADCDINQNLSTLSSPTFASVGLTASGTGSASLWNYTGNILRTGANNIIQIPTTAVTTNTIPKFNGTGSHLLQPSGVTVDGSNNMSGVGTLGVSGTITSTYSSTTAKVLDFPLHGDAHSYSYMGFVNPDYSFILCRGGDNEYFPNVCMSSSGSASIRTSAANAFYFVTGASPFGDNITAKIDGTTKGFYHQSESTYYNSFSTNTSLGTSDNIICSQNAIKSYVDSQFSSGTFSVTWTGPWAADKTTTINFSRSKNIISLTFPGAHSTSNKASTIDATTTAVPLALRPATASTVPVIVYDTTIAIGYMVIDTTGNIRILNPVGYGDFGNGVDVGLCSTNQTISYNLL